jgi:hypothetical protein
MIVCDRRSHVGSHRLCSPSGRRRAWNKFAVVHQTIVPYQLYVDKSNFDDKVGAHVICLLCYLHRSPTIHDA